MPDQPPADAYQSVGYLIAAAGITIVSLAGYAVLLTQRLSKAKARNVELTSGLRK
jgi:hypothetical protein